MRALLCHEMRAVVVTIAVALAPVAARADAVEEAARVHLDRGIAAFQAGDFTRAHRELAAAHDLAPDRANPYRWLALTEIQLGDCASALVNLEAFLTRVGPDDPRVAEMVRLRELCQRTGALRITSVPPSATLRIDGAVVGTTPYVSLSMRAGSHDVIADKRGYHEAKRTVVVDGGSDIALELTLPPVRASITKQWWFWTAVGVVALGVTGAVIYAASDDDPTVLPPIHCNALGCMP